MDRDNWDSATSSWRRGALLAAAIILGSGGALAAGPLPGEPIAIDSPARPVQASQDEAQAATEAASTPLEELNAALAAARAKLDELKSAAEIAAITEDLRAQLHLAKEKNRRLADELEQAQGALKAARTRLGDVEEQAEALRQRSARQESLVEAAEQSAAQVTRLRETLAAGKDRLATAERERQEAQARLAELKETLSGALAQAAQLRSQNDRLEQSLAAARTQADRLRAERTDMEERLAHLQEAAATATNAARANLLAMEDKIVSLNTALADVRLQNSATEATSKAPPPDRGEVTAQERARQAVRAPAATLPPLPAVPAAAREAVVPEDDGVGVKPELDNRGSDAPHQDDGRSLARATAALSLEQRMQVQALLADLKAEPEARGLRLTVPGRMLFTTNSERVEETAHETLAKVAEVIDIYDDHGVLITGHTDAIGEAAYNEFLSERRAALVKAFFVDNFGIDDTRLLTRGLGEEQPIASNATRDGREANRRVEVLILD